MRKARWLVLAGAAVACVVAIAFLLRGETPAAAFHEDSASEGPSSGSSTVLAEVDHGERDAISAPSSVPSTRAVQEEKEALADVRWTIRGRALDAGFAALSNASVEAKLYRIEAVPSGRERTLGQENRSTTTTDALGRFEIRPTLPRAPEPGERELVLVAYDRPTQIEWRGFARTSLANPTATDVGDVVLAPAPTILSGIVVDPSGAPVKYVFVGASDPDDPGRAEDDRVGPAGQTRYSGLDGRFAVPSWTRAKRVSVWAGTRDYVSAPMPDVEVPTSDLRIVVRPSDTASLRFTLLVDDENCGRRLVGRVRRVGDEATPGVFLRNSEHDQERKDQVFRPIDPGEYDLEIFDPLTSIMLDRIPGLHVVEHQECADERLHPIDLRGRFTCAKARLTSESGRPLGFDKLTIDGPGGKSVLISDQDGWIYLAIPPGASEVAAADPRGSRVPIVDGATIVLRTH